MLKYGGRYSPICDWNFESSVGTKAVAKLNYPSQIKTLGDLSVFVFAQQTDIRKVVCHEHMSCFPIL